MPVRIYDIAKKLGIESKEVLAKAKDLGISAARVPSSSLDKITAEFLEENLRPIARTPAPPPPTPEPIIVVTAPPPPAEPPATFPQPVEEPVFVTAESIAAPARPSSSPVVAEVSAPVAEPVAPLPPPVPPKPGIGDLMGRIILPVRPVRDKAPPPPQRPAMGGGRTEFVRRPDPREIGRASCRERV